MTEGFGLTTYRHHETGKRRWGCRGIGEAYQEFYRWFDEQVAAGKVDADQTDDWPWHYWGFNDPELDTYMFTRYKNDIFAEELMPEFDEPMEMTTTPEADNAPEQEELIIQRMQDSPERKVYEVDVRGLSNAETEAKLEEVRTRFVDGQLELETEAANDNQENEPIQIIDPEKMAIQGMGVFHTLQVGQNPMTGEIEMGIVQLPLPLDMIRAFQEQMGEEMAKENMKFVIYKGRIYLAPIRTSTLLGFD